ncbi:MAG: tagaturonate epimerase family protein [Chloroflexota bacterium]
MKTIPSSLVTTGNTTYFLAQDTASNEPYLGVRGPDQDFSDLHHTIGSERYYPLTAANAAALRQRLDWLNPAPLGLATSFGFGDRLGLATPGHIEALRQGARPGAPGLAPVFAQQSVRENTRTGRTPQGVLDDAMWGVFRQGWRSPWGADADHLKQVSDLLPFVQAGYSFFTIDPGDHVDPAADSDSIETLQAKFTTLPWDVLQSSPALQRQTYLQSDLGIADLELAFDEPTLLRAAAKYGKAIAHILVMYRELVALKSGTAFDFEVSVDETDTPTSVPEHFYITSELTRLGVQLTSLAPRFPGRFEKGVDYIGDIVQLEAEIARHAAIMRHFAEHFAPPGGYKISLHSGSDKFSAYPILARHAGSYIHVKTAGTSYLEALRLIARIEPPLFRQVLTLACQRYPIERQSYHVSADEKRLPSTETIQSLPDACLPGFLDDFHARQALHVTFGAALTQHGDTIKALLRANPAAYADTLRPHFRRHLEPFEAPERAPIDQPEQRPFPQDLFDLRGKVAVVTGGAGVLCSAMCAALAAAGASVAVLDLFPEAAQKIAGEIISSGGQALGLGCDVLDQPALEAAAQAVIQAFGRVDILINGAGGNKKQATTSPELCFFDLPGEALESVFALNFTGTLLPCQVFGKLMAAQGEGIIVNISSMNAFRPLTRIPAYSAAKAAVSNFTQWLAVHLAQEYSPNIRVNAIAPGFFLTEQNRFLLTDAQTGALTARGQQIITHTPQGRFGTPQDLFSTLLWLASPGASFVNGVVVPVDGGFSAFSGV